MNKITIVPIGGLANRMLAISSFIAYCQENNNQLEVIWFRDKGLNCSFRDLFETFLMPNVIIRDATWFDNIFLDRPRNRNFKLTKYWHRIFFQKQIYEEEYYAIGDNPEAKDAFFASILPYSSVYIVACCQIYNKFSWEYLSPRPIIQDKIKEIVKAFSSRMIGIHIRRTDNFRSINSSPLELYIQKMQEEVQNYPETLFYVASDSTEEKVKLKELFQTKIITSFQPVQRDSETGIMNALAEMYALSNTQKIYGSHYSTFAQVAAMISRIPSELFS